SGWEAWLVRSAAAGPRRGREEGNMANFTNPRVAASNSIFDTLAQRDVAQRLEAERQAEAARQAEELELRCRQIASAEENTRSLIAAREAERRWLDEEAARRRAESERQQQLEAA